MVIQIARHLIIFFITSFSSWHLQFSKTAFENDFYHAFTCCISYFPNTPSPNFEAKNNIKLKALVYNGPGKKSWDEKPIPTIIDATDANEG